MNGMGYISDVIRFRPRTGLSVREIRADPALADQKSLRDFCGTQCSFVVLSRDICNGRHAASC